MVEEIHEILCTILKLLHISGENADLPKAILYDIAKFTQTLQKIFTYVTGLQKTSKIKLLFRLPANSTIQVRATGSTLSQLGQMKKDARFQHEELLAFLKSHPVFIQSDQPFVSESIALLPPSPHIFHGRESELQLIVKILNKDSPRIDILGAGGIGKSSLSTAALHHPEVEAKYPQRCFIPCHSAPTTAQLVSSIADYIGVEKGPNLARKLVNHFTYAPPTLLILNNLETVWEPSTSRSEVEEFLSLLTDAAFVGLIVTMRGAERPEKVKWTRPFLNPLQPLSNSAALETFIDVADDTYPEDNIHQLLDLTGNLPLAVSLIASVAAVTKCFLCGSLKAPEFSQMDMTKDPAWTCREMVQFQLPIPKVMSHKATLLRTSLAHVVDQRLKVLVPIQEYTLRTHPPSEALKLKLRQHFYEPLSLWDQFRYLNAAAILAQMSQNLGNVDSVFKDGLNTGAPDFTQNWAAILFLNQFYRRTQNRCAQLFINLSEQLTQWQGQSIFGDYLVELIESCDHLPVKDAEHHIRLGDEHFASKDSLQQGKQNGILLLELTFAGGKQFFNAIKSYGRGLALSDASGSSHIMAQRALCAMAFIMSNTGDFLGAKKHAIRAQEYAQYLGDVYAQAYASYTSQMSYDICGLSVCSSSLPTGHRSFGIITTFRGPLGRHLRRPTQTYAQFVWSA
ncbi:hypothetical protein C8J57DRAFT_1674654 [Mycena rebaudengoi]|nr:hypothetical protein C8J57DRAFT_1674654 [Mycena rebaudengoi]